MKLDEFTLEMWIYFSTKGNWVLGQLAEVDVFKY